MLRTFVDVVGVDASRRLGQWTVVLRGAVEEETVVVAGMFVGVEHSHAALCTFTDSLRLTLDPLEPFMSL